MFSILPTNSHLYMVYFLLIAIGLGLTAGFIFRRFYDREGTYILVVLDDSEEIFNALRYAAKRSARTNGRVALLYTFETLEFSHWKAVEDIAEIELREEAESKLKNMKIM